MRRVSQNFGLDKIPASAPSSDRSQGFGLMSFLKVDDTGLNFLTGVSLFKNSNGIDVHLSFGDQFGSVIFLYALHEDNTSVPAQLLCLDKSAFERFAYPTHGTSDPIPPAVNEWVRFNTDEFLDANKTIDQESLIRDNASFKQVVTRFIKHLGQMKNQSNYHDIFHPTLRNVVEEDHDEQQKDDMKIVTTANNALDNDGKKKKTENSQKKTKSDKEINRAYNEHVTPRKRTATVLYNVEAEAPKVLKPPKTPKVIIDMNALEKEEDMRIDDKGKSKTKGKKQKGNKATTKKDTTKTKRSAVNKSVKTADNIKVISADSELKKDDTAEQGNPRKVSTAVRTLKDDIDEREYLRRQTIMDMDVDTKRQNQIFDMVERANRMS